MLHQIEDGHPHTVAVRHDSNHRNTLGSGTTPSWPKPLQNQCTWRTLTVPKLGLAYEQVSTEPLEAGQSVRPAPDAQADAEPGTTNPNHSLIPGSGRPLP
ncbi:hypothetical protein GCM10010271_22540 [Streptomyces kurssanovii]|nr:hypothetical protein GCM10010271_22540 [Streptomyces kurssanovii]